MGHQICMTFNDSLEDTNMRQLQLKVSAKNIIISIV